MMQPVIVDNIVMKYRVKKTVVDALKGVSFTVNKGEIFGLIGPDGAGKTSLFRILTTLLLAESGKAFVDGFDVVEKSGLSGLFGRLFNRRHSPPMLHINISGVCKRVLFTFSLFSLFFFFFFFCFFFFFFFFFFYLISHCRLFWRVDPFVRPCKSDWCRGGSSFLVQKFKSHHCVLCILKKFH